MKYAFGLLIGILIVFILAPIIVVAGLDTFNTSRLMGSPDGTTWSLLTDPAVNGFGEAVAYSPSLGLWVVVADNGWLTSPDGLTWMARLSAFTSVPSRWRTSRSATARTPSIPPNGRPCTIGVP